MYIRIMKKLNIGFTVITDWIIHILFLLGNV